MHVCLCEHTGDPLQSRFKEIQSLIITIPVITDFCQLLTGCQFTYFMLHHHFQWSHCSVYIPASHRSSPTGLTACLTPTPRQGAVCTAHTACSTLHGVMACLCSQEYSSPLEAPPPDHYWLLFAVFGNHGQFSVQQSGCHLLSPLMSSLLCISAVYQRIQLGWTYVFSKSFPKSLWGTVFRGEHFCVTVPCLNHLQQSFDVQTYNILTFQHS